MKFLLFFILYGIGEDFQEKTKLTPLNILGSIIKLKKEVSPFKVYPDKLKIKLPEPDYKGKIFEEIIKKRRSVRNYSSSTLSLKEVSQLVFSASGITSKYLDMSLRTVPSAGALYPIELYLVVNNVLGLEKGVYHYNVKEHSLEFIRKGDFKNDLFKSSIFQEMFLEAPLVFIYTAIFDRTINKYGDRGYRYIYIEAGHIAQNVALQCVSLGLVSCVVGAFFDDMVNKIIGVDGKKESAIYIQTIGKPK